MPADQTTDSDALRPRRSAARNLDRADVAERPVDRRSHTGIDIGRNFDLALKRRIATCALSSGSHDSLRGLVREAGTSARGRLTPWSKLRAVGQLEVDHGPVRSSAGSGCRGPWCPAVKSTRSPHCFRMHDTQGTSGIGPVFQPRSGRRTRRATCSWRDRLANRQVGRTADLREYSMPSSSGRNRPAVDHVFGPCDGRRAV